MSTAERYPGIFRLWLVVLMGAPLWWFLGLNLFVYHLLSIVLFLCILYAAGRFGHGLTIPGSAFIILILCFVYGVSLLMHMEDSDFDRTVASVYNLSFWVMGFLLVICVSNLFTGGREAKVIRGIASIGWSLGLLALLSVFLASKGTKLLMIPTPLYPLTKYLGHSTLIENSLAMQILHWDWLAGESVPRLTALAPYSTATGNLALMVLVFVLAMGRQDKKMMNPFYLFLIVSTTFALFMTMSRTAILGFFYVSCWSFSLSGEVH